MTEILARWLEALPAVQRAAPQGICTGTGRAGAGAVLTENGVFRIRTDISGARTVQRGYTLFLRGACMTQAQSAALAASAQEIAGAILAADAAQQLPAGAEALTCTGLRLYEADDSGLGTRALTLLFTGTLPDAPAQQKG